MGQTTYVKPKSKQVIIIIVIMSLIIFTWLIDIPPTWIYKFAFYGESTLRHGDLTYTFQPSLVQTPLGYMLHFKTTATNISNETAGYQYGYGEPEVLLNGLNGVYVATFYKSRNIPAMAITALIPPGGSHSEEWTWGLNSMSTAPLLPGVYFVSARVYVEDFSTHLETSRMLMIMLF